MDPLTHTCSGIIIGHALRPAEPVRRLTLLLAGLAAFSPDVDAVSYLWGPDAYYLFHHTYTHTLVGMAVLALSLAAIEKIWVVSLSFTRLLALNLAGCSIHLLGDLIALWPLHILWPFSDHDFTLHWTGDFDLVVMILVCLTAGLAETDQLRAYVWWLIAGCVVLLVAYFVFFPGWAGLQ
jgi:membrane-bound metal-dependent hydrolase YbcI (DUF457 family)